MRKGECQGSRLAAHGGSALGTGGTLTHSCPRDHRRIIICHMSSSASKQPVHRRRHTFKHKWLVDEALTHCSWPGSGTRCYQVGRPGCMTCMAGWPG